MASAKPAVVAINPDDFLETDGTRVWTAERDADAWARSYVTLAEAIVEAGELRRVVLVCGVQGAGKTTWIASQPASPATIYFDAALRGVRHRARIVDMARDLGATIDAVWIKIPVEIALERNARRPPDKVVPAAAVLSVADQFEEPTTAEGFRRVLIVDAGPAPA